MPQQRRDPRSVILPRSLGGHTIPGQAPLRAAVGSRACCPGLTSLRFQGPASPCVRAARGKAPTLSGEVGGGPGQLAPDAPHSQQPAATPPPSPGPAPLCAPASGAEELGLSQAAPCSRRSRPRRATSGTPRQQILPWRRPSLWSCPHPSRKPASQTPGLQTVPSSTPSTPTPHPDSGSSPKFGSLPSVSNHSQPSARPATPRMSTLPVSSISVAFLLVTHSKPFPPPASPPRLSVHSLPAPEKQKLGPRT